MKILFVDDDYNSIEPLSDYLQDERKYECHKSDFNNFEKYLNIIKPEIIILDLMEGMVEDPTGDAGKQVCEKVWSDFFCPIIVYSANPDLTDFKHPLFYKVTKGNKSKIDVDKAISELMPYLTTINSVSDQIEKISRNCLRDIVPLILNNKYDNVYKTIEYLTIRRISSILDSNPRNLKKIETWEQYIFPPIGEYLFLGDIVKANNTDIYDVGNYRLILSPSCDLEKTESRDIKIDNVLTAKFITFKEGIKRNDYNIPNVKSKNKIDNLTKILKETKNSLMFFPEIKSIIPNMFVDFKKTELIPIDEIYSKTPKYRRILSIDSPFREQISWEYIQIAGRPGPPDKDFKKTAENILDELICEEKIRNN